MEGTFILTGIPPAECDPPLDLGEKSYAHQTRDVNALRARNKLRRTIYIRGKLVVFKEGTATGGPPPRKRPGCIIKAFSAKSRLNCLTKIAQIDWNQVARGVFITLTYPDDRARVEPHVANMQKNHFIRHAEKYLGEKIPIMWCKEYIDRKSGRYKGMLVHHYHLSLFGVPFVPHQLVKQWWVKCIKATGPTATDIEAMDSGEHAAFYLCKYLAKRKEAPYLDDLLKLTNCGRHWGINRPELIPHHEADCTGELTQEKWDEIVEQCGALRQGLELAGSGNFRLLGDRAIEAAKIIYEILA